MSKSKKILYGLCALVLVFTCCASALVRGQIADATDESTQQQLQISPTDNHNIKLNPGDHYSGSYHVQNIGTQTVRFKVSAGHFYVENGSYNRIYDQPGTYTQMANWITFNMDEANIAPNGDIEVRYTINVPADVPAGGQYAALYTQIVDQSDDTGSVGVKPVYRLAYLLYAQVNGDTRATGSISDNDISGIFLNPPITATAKIKNTGNIHGELTDVIEVYSAFSNEEVYSNAKNPATTTILPETEYDSSVAWEGAPIFGIFKVKHTVELFGQKSVTEKIVLVCPLWLMIIIAVVIVGLVTWIIMRARERKKHGKKSKDEKEA